MAEYNDTGYQSFPVSAALGQHLRVNVNTSGQLTLAGIGDQDIGVTRNATFAVGDVVTVVERSKPGTHKAVANGAIDIGDLVFTAADGKVSASQGVGAFLRGKAISAAGADNDILEVMPLSGDTAGS